MRKSNIFPIKWLNGQTVSVGVHQLDGGAFGTFIVPAGSDAAGKTIQFVATKQQEGRGVDIPDTDLLSAAKSLTAGANALTADEITEVGAADYVKFKLNSSVSEDTTIYLMWKS